jgi:hypothetical protein
MGKNLVVFLKLRKIADPERVFDKLIKLQIWYVYFCIDTEYYLFGFSEKNHDINFLFDSIKLIKLLHSRKRKIRSLRGFFLYVLEFIENDKCEILKTNLEPLFWIQVQEILKQNRKEPLENFLFSNSRQLLQT